MPSSTSAELLEPDNLEDVLVPLPRRTRSSHALLFQELTPPGSPRGSVDSPRSPNRAAAARPPSLALAPCLAAGEASGLTRPRACNTGNHAAFGKVTQGLDLLDKVLEADTFKSVRACSSATCCSPRDSPLPVASAP